MEKTKYQIYGIDKDGELTHAGVHESIEMNQKTARKIEREWKKWKRDYLANNPGDYPLRHTKKTAIYQYYALGYPEIIKQIYL